MCNLVMLKEEFHPRIDRVAQELAGPVELPNPLPGKLRLQVHLSNTDVTQGFVGLVSNGLVESNGLR